jgi:NAD-dependent dihydropyrimidine dehydrogenase PreA subunit
LEKEAKELKATSLCGLGQSAANPILSTIRYFRAEYLEHEEGYCRSGRCKDMYLPWINTENCKACGACQKNCPTSAIDGKKKEPRVIETAKCISCGACLKSCAFSAITAQRRPNA